MRHLRILTAFAVMTIAALAEVSAGHAQVQTQVPPVVPGAKPVTVERIKIHGPALEGNLEGNAVDRDALVFLPPSYRLDSSRRYPVVYALHGYSIGAEQWSSEIRVPQTIEGAFAQGGQEMIVVLPDSQGGAIRKIPSGKRNLKIRDLSNGRSEVSAAPMPRTHFPSGTR